MALGILAERKLTRVPGTVHLEEQQRQQESLAQRSDLKHGTGRDAHIVLVPQPSDDPNDPLNWSMFKKIYIILIVFFGTCIIPATFGPLLSAGTGVIAEELNTSISSVTLMSGYQLLVSGCFGPIVNMLARKYGKRPQFLFASLIGLIGSIMGSLSTDIGTLRAARVVQGFAVTAYETLIFSIVGDLFFVHQRGMFISLMSFALVAVSNLASVICGPITTSLGWKYLFHCLDAILGFQLTLVYLFVPETSYARSSRLELDELAGADLTPTGTKDEKELAIYTGSHSDEKMLSLLVAPIMCNLNVAALWMVVTVGSVNAFFVAQSYVAAQIYFYPPYNLSAAGVGYIYVGPFAGALAGSIILTLVMDPLILWCTRRNKGVYEPEFCLLPCAIGLVGGVGMTTYGYSVQHHWNMYACSFFWGLSMFGIIFLFTPANSYLIDAFREISAEVYISNMMLKNFLFYAFSYFVNDWAAAEGPGQVFYVFGGLTFGITLTAIPVYVFGKRYRSFWCRHNVLAKLGIKTHADGRREH